jgi:hypothetical protein
MGRAVLSKDEHSIIEDKKKTMLDLPFRMLFV